MGRKWERDRSKIIMCVGDGCGLISVGCRVGLLWRWRDICVEVWRIIKV